MPKHPNPELIDNDNPEWTDADFSRTRPVAEVLPELFGNAAAHAMLKPRGRPVAQEARFPGNNVEADKFPSRSD